MRIEIALHNIDLLQVLRLLCVVLEELHYNGSNSQSFIKSCFVSCLITFSFSLHLMITISLWNPRHLSTTNIHLVLYLYCDVSVFQALIQEMQTNSKGSQYLLINLVLVIKIQEFCGFFICTDQPTYICPLCLWLGIEAIKHREPYLLFCLFVCFKFCFF